MISERARSIRVINAIKGASTADCYFRGGGYDSGEFRGKLRFLINQQIEHYVLGKTKVERHLVEKQPAAQTGHMKCMDETREKVEMGKQDKPKVELEKQDKTKQKDGMENMIMSNK